MQKKTPPLLFCPDCHAQILTIPRVPVFDVRRCKCWACDKFFEIYRNEYRYDTVSISQPHIKVKVIASKLKPLSQLPRQPQTKDVVAVKKCKHHKSEIIGVFTRNVEQPNLLSEESLLALTKKNSKSVLIGV